MPAIASTPSQSMARGVREEAGSFGGVVMSVSEERHGRRARIGRPCGRFRSKPETRANPANYGRRLTRL
jgi:hypothetical protein